MIFPEIAYKAILLVRLETGINTYIRGLATDGRQFSWGPAASSYRTYLPASPDAAENSGVFSTAATRQKFLLRDTCWAGGAIASARTIARAGCSGARTC
ncbi:protein of unknown function [Hyphomicrobium sp. 1Nfss2.1]